MSFTQRMKPTFSAALPNVHEKYCASLERVNSRKSCGEVSGSGHLRTTASTMKFADFCSITRPLEIHGSSIVTAAPETLRKTSRYVADCIKNVAPTCPTVVLACAEDLSWAARVRCLLESNVPHQKMQRLMRLASSRKFDGAAHGADSDAVARPPESTLRTKEPRAASANAAKAAALLS